ncbi:MAG: hypothetical protein EBT06_00775 [Gammaproteobacteria bacterium]|nr:hypothetical protein [Gammaproteobacteria bacterium]NBT43456.1 hypothetical protein [Gammaproteobacteria bacterium]NBY21687.1 hypothetical protein [Gammaproteobacteria bacterium]
MKVTQLTAIITFALLSLSTAQAGKLCTKSTSTLAQGVTFFGYYNVTFNTGDDATVDGSQCYLQPSGKEDCVPAYGAMAYEDGTIEMSTSGTNDIILPPYGKVIGFATRHTEIDPNTKVGTTTFITNFTAGGKVTQQVDSGVVEVIDCPKITPLDRENLRNLKKFIRSTSR